MRSFFLLLFLILIPRSIFSQDYDTLIYHSLSPDDFLTILTTEKNAVLIDVRMPSEFRSKRIEGAVNIPLSKTGRRHAKHLSAGSVLLLYCVSDTRSGWAARKYYDLGYRKIYDLDGGITAWERKGLPVEGRKKKK